MRSVRPWLRGMCILFKLFRFRLDFPTQYCYLFYFSRWAFDGIIETNLILSNDKWYLLLFYYSLVHLLYPQKNCASNFYYFLWICKHSHRYAVLHQKLKLFLCLVEKHAFELHFPSFTLWYFCVLLKNLVRAISIFFINL